MHNPTMIPITIAIAAAAGITHQLLLGPIWFYVATRSPTVDWILGQASAGWYPPLWYALLSIHDAVINVLLTLPLAVLISYANPSRRWLLAAAAVAAGFVYTYRGVLPDPTAYWPFLDSYTALLGVAMALLSLPVAMLLVRGRSGSGPGAW